MSDEDEGVVGDPEVQRLEDQIYKADVQMRISRANFRDGEFRELVWGKTRHYSGMTGQTCAGVRSITVRTMRREDV